MTSDRVLTVSLCVSSVVHEMNGEDGVQLLSYSEVEELLQQADQAFSRSQEGTSLPMDQVQEEVQEVQQELQQEVQQELQQELQHQEEAPLAEIKGVESEVGGAPGVAEASPTHPVTMVFMGFQNVEDEDETRRVLGLQGTVTAQLVHLQDGGAECRTSPGQREAEPPATPIAPPPSTGASAVEGEEPKAAAVAQVKDKQPCKCCSIM